MSLSAYRRRAGREIVILHSIIAMDDIFCKNSVNAPMYKEINGGILELDNFGDGAQIKRLHSTNPYLYLDKRYTPYTKINNGH